MELGNSPTQGIMRLAICGPKTRHLVPSLGDALGVVVMKKPSYEKISQW